MSAPVSAPATIATLLERAGVPPDRLDLDWLQVTTADAESAIVALRTDPRFAAARPAFSTWPELAWSSPKAGQ
jgi:hypothetical protein